MEESIIKSDIFFFVTTICVVLISFLFIIVFVYGIKVLKDIRSLVSKAKEEGEAIIDDVRETRMAIKEKSGNLFSILFSFLNNIANSSKKKRREKNTD